MYNAVWYLISKEAAPLRVHFCVDVPETDHFVTVSQVFGNFWCRAPLTHVWHFNHEILTFFCVDWNAAQQERKGDIKQCVHAYRVLRRDPIRPRNPERLCEWILIIYKGLNTCQVDVKYFGCLNFPRRLCRWIIKCQVFGAPYWRYQHRFSCW